MKFIEIDNQLVNIAQITKAVYVGPQPPATPQKVIVYLNGDASPIVKEGDRATEIYEEIKAFTCP